MTGAHEFGIALYAKEQLEMLPELEKQFALLEIPGEMLDSSVMEKIRTMDVLVRDLSPRQVLSELPLVSQGVKNDFFRMFSLRCNIMKRISACRATVRVDFERIFDDPGYADAYMEILRCCYGIAWKCDVKLGVELRIPGIAGMWEKIRSFRSRSGCGFFIENDFHPHENGSFDAAKQLDGKMLFDSGLWRISFDGASGNYPGAEVLRQVMSLAKTTSCASPVVIFAPGSGVDFEVYRSLCATVQTLKKEIEK